VLEVVGDYQRCLAVLLQVTRLTDEIAEGVQGITAKGRAWLERASDRTRITDLLRFRDFLSENSAR